MWASRGAAHVGDLLGALRRDARGSMVSEFALVVPIMFLLSIGILELALVAFDYHRAGEATRAAARTATIEPPIASLAAVVAGGTVRCTGGAETVVCDNGAIITPETFDQIMADLQERLPTIGPDNVEIVYSLSGLGDDTTPGGILPLVRVNLVGVEHPYLVLGNLVPGIPNSLTLPGFSTAQLAGSHKE